MEYRGYTARVEYDDVAESFHGQVLHIRDVVTFEATSVAGLKREFAASVEDYLALCASRGEEPEKPCSGKFLMRVPPELHRAAATAAAQAGLSLNQWVANAIEGTLEARRRRRAG